MKKKLGILSLLAIAAILPAACGKKDNNDFQEEIKEEKDQLDAYKAQAKMDLDSYLQQELTENNVVDVNQEIALTLNVYKETIDSASVRDIVTQAVKEGKITVDKLVKSLVEKALIAKKEAAITQFNVYSDNLLAKEELVADTAFTAGKIAGEYLINGAKRIDEVDTQLNKAKENMDAIVALMKESQNDTQLANAITDALIELDNLIANELQTNNLDTTKEFDDLVTLEKSNIKSAQSLLDLANIKEISFNNVLAKIAELKANKDLSLLKEDYKNQLVNYKNEYLALNNVKENTTIYLAVENGKLQIDNANDSLECGNKLVEAKATVKALIDEIVNSNSSLQALNEAKTNAINEIKQYKDEQILLNNVIDDGSVSNIVATFEANVLKASTIDEIDALKQSSKTEIDEAIDLLVGLNALNEAKANAINELNTYASNKLTELNLVDDGSVELELTKQNGLINSKLTTLEVSEQLELSKQAIDSAISNMQSLTDEQKLSNAKENALNTLLEYKNSQYQINSIDITIAIEDAYNLGCTNINAASTITDVTASLNAATAKIDEEVNKILAERHLNTLKENAKSTLLAYKDSKLGELVDDGSVNARYLEAVAVIDNSLTEDAINIELTAAKADIDSLVQALSDKLALADAKADAIALLEAYKVSSLGSLTDDGSVENALNEGINAINLATTIDDVDLLLADAKANIDNCVSVIRQAKELADAKAKAINDISIYANQKLATVNLENDATISEIVANATNEINLLTDILSINDKVTEVRALIDARINEIIKANQQAQLQTAIKNAIQELNGYYNQVISSVSDDGSIEKVYNDYYAILNSSTSEDMVTTNLLNGKNAIDEAANVIKDKLLESYKQKVIINLDVYANSSLSSLGLKDDGVVLRALETGINEINACTTTKSVDAAYEKAKVSVDSAIKRLQTGDVYAEDVDSPSDLGGVVVTQGNIEIIESGGWQESGYVKFKPYTGASGYKVYYKAKGAADSTYKVLDDMLIRDYGDYIRADVLGIKKGSYQLKVVGIKNGVEDAMSASTVQFKATSHEREGFAFASYSTYGHAGAYTKEGTIASGTNIVYLTDANASTVKATLGGVECTGIQAIINQQAKLAKEGVNTPLIIRMIGEIKASSMGSNINSSTYLQIKGSSSYSNLKITFEGVGDDAWCNGWGILCRSAGNVEIRNIAVRDFGDDGISLDTDNCNVWIHNNDFFYGKQGSGDKAKGDGSLDVKGDSQYVSFGYNHFFDTGKVSLCGMTSETQENWITYHHNWFDHSDSRHPRIRTMSVHIYNNYYDGVAKYGVGTTLGSSAFVEENYFRNTKYPMLISLQGHDYYDYTTNTNLAKGTFSGEAGGMIKSYNNTIVEGGNYQKYVKDNLVYSVQFDAYEAITRTETVPSTVKSLSGGNTYNNFDTSTEFINGYTCTPDAVDTVPATVMAYSGRMQGGDFKFEFTNAVDDASYDINQTLRTQLDNHKVNLVKILGSKDFVTGTITDDMVAVATTDDFIQAVNAIHVAYTPECLSKINDALSIYEGLDNTDKQTVASQYNTLLAYKDQYDTLAATEVINLINKIPSTITIQAKTTIENAKVEYDKLTNEQKAKVTNYDKLEQAINQLENLKVQNTIDLINNIGVVNANSKVAIESARASYNELTDAQKQQVTNYQTLVTAEAQFENFKVQAVIDSINNLTSPSSATSKSDCEIILNQYNKVLEDYEALTAEQKAKVTNYSTLQVNITTIKSNMNVYNAIELIDNIGEVTNTSGSKIAEARTAYDFLTTDERSKVTNYQKLVDAENLFATMVQTYTKSFSTATETLSSSTGTTTDGFTYKINGTSGSSIKIKNSSGNFIKLDNINSAKVTIELTVQMVDTSNATNIDVLITYADGTTETKKIMSAANKAYSTETITINTKEVQSISVVGASENASKNAGLKDITVTYEK